MDHTPNNSLLNMPVGLTFGWGIAYRYLLVPAIGGRNYLSIPIVVTNRFRLICAIGYCKSGIGTCKRLSIPFICSIGSENFVP